MKVRYSCFFKKLISYENSVWSYLQGIVAGDFLIFITVFNIDVVYTVVQIAVINALITTVIKLYRTLSVNIFQKSKITVWLFCLKLSSSFFPFSFSFFYHQSK